MPLGRFNERSFTFGLFFASHTTESQIDLVFQYVAEFINLGTFWAFIHPALLCCLHHGQTASSVTISLTSRNISFYNLNLKHFSSNNKSFPPLLQCLSHNDSFGKMTLSDWPTFWLSSSSGAIYFYVGNYGLPFLCCSCQFIAVNSPLPTQPTLSAVALLFPSAKCTDLHLKLKTTKIGSC